MLVYPQLSTGALSQFPVQKRRRLRTVVNRAADGSVVKLADPAGETTEWSLTYSALTDEELKTLEQFFAAAEGTLNTFAFLDPTSNLLAWSDQLGNAVWQRDPLLELSGNVSDPAGGSRAWHLTNKGAAEQGIAQTLSAPSDYLYCLSAWVRATSPTVVTLTLGGVRYERTASSEWSRISAAQNGAATFGLAVPADSTVDVFGMQAEAQLTPSLYRSSATGGVYEEARLRDDSLQITTTGINEHSCTVNIIHANHI
jgi:hypothetical protein